MTELFNIHILSPNVRTCFFYLNDSNLKFIKQSKRAIKIRFGLNRENITYGCISLTPILEVPDKYMGVSSLYANKLGLKENDVILVSYCDVDSVDSLQIIPKNKEDYIILLSCSTILETYLLNQVSVVAKGQVLPLYIFSNIFIEVEIGELNLTSGYGQLEKFTEIKVLHPSEKPNNSTKMVAQTYSEFLKEKENFTGGIFSHLNKILKDNFSLNQINELIKGELILKHLMENVPAKIVEYKIQSCYLFPKDLPKIVKERFIVVSNFKNLNNIFGPCCVKMLAKVVKVDNVKKKTKSNDKDDEEQDFFLHTYVIAFCNHNSALSNDSNIAFCPSFVMKKLKLFVGSKISIEQSKPNSKSKLCRWPEKVTKNEFSNCFWKGMTFIYENVRQTVINNFQFNYKINSLILGRPGMGKTFLLTEVLNEFTNKFIFCKLIQCKSLRGKKIESLHKLFNDNLRECAYQEPSIVLLDDLHALTYIDDDEGRFNKLYSDRVVELLSDILKDFQRKFNISIIATSVNMSQLSAFVSRHGPRVFQNVLNIPEMSNSERNFALNNIMNGKINVNTDFLLDFNKLSESTNGYTIQDLNDLVEKALFNCLLRTETGGKITEVTQLDFDSALAESTPLNLRGMKLKHDVVTKWDNVGGMIETKKILTEVFSWPLKYSRLLETCPLRLQRGVLLYGAPGTGKTLLAGALANECGLNFISVKGPEVLSKYVGASEEGVRNLFLQAEKTQPSLLFFDEFDSLAPKRGHDNTGVTDRVVNQLLTQLDGVESLNGVWVLAASSRPDLLDPALLRPGRLDKTVFCDLPDQADRLSILEVLSQNLLLKHDVNLLELAKMTEGYTGADLQSILYSGQMWAIKEDKNSLGKKIKIEINQNHLSKALSEVKPSLSQKERERYKKLYEKFLNSRKKNVVESFEEGQRVTLA